MTEAAILLRASAAPGWMTCSARQEAIEEQQRDPQRPMHVGALVGNRVHAAVTGHMFDEPARVQYDEVTQTASEASRQSKAYSEEIKDFLAAESAQIIETEIPLAHSFSVGEVEVQVKGTVDMLLRHHQKNVDVLCDVKVGKMAPDAAIVQIAVYCLLWAHVRPEHEIIHAAVLWRKRGGEGLQYRKSKPFGDMLILGEDVVRRMARIASDGASPTPSRDACATCPKTDCPARME